MRRVRLKVAPNLVSGPRSSKNGITNAGNDPNIKEPTLSVDEPIAVQDLPLPPSSLTLNVDNSLSCEAVLPPAKPVMAIELPVEEVTPHCIDKENVITGASDEVSSENLVNSSANEQNTSAPSLPRYKPKNKIRPVITQAAHRIRTFSSASESEEDLAKRQSRTPLSPVKKSPAKMDNVEATPLPTKIVTEKEKKGRKKRNEKTPLEMKKAIMRQKFAKGEVDRSKLTMFDLIYYNPDDGERPPNATEKLQMRLKPYEVEALSLENQAEREESTGNAILDERLAEEEEIRQNEDNPQIETNDEEKQQDETDEDKQIADVEVVEEEEEEEEDAMPVPQVRLGPDGEIILDERSLVIDTSETKRNKNQLANTPIIIENSSTTVNYGSWRKRPRAGRWSVKETARFYRALNMLGTNFSLMVKLFPGRDRIDLKRKFKSEEKTNPSLVDKIIATQIPFDISQFMDVEDEDSSGNENTSKEPSKKKTAGKAYNVRKSSTTTSKEPKMKRKEKALKNSETQKPVNDDECDSDKVLGEPLESPTKKIPSKNSDEEVEPPSKKGRKLRVAESPVGCKKPAGSRIEKLKEMKTASQCESDGYCSASKNTITIQPTSPEKNAHLTSPNNNPLVNLLNSPLGQIGLEQGGLTVVENSEASKQTPSFLVPPALAEANPAFAQAEPGSLVLVSEQNPGDPNNQLVHVYRISVPVEQVPL